jgi:lipopolysaccharide transport system ATP-binding protein
MNTVIRFKNVSKQYQLGTSRTSLLKSLAGMVQKVVKTDAQLPTKQEALWALRDISFDLARGESLALIGRNGAGKSTLLKLLANITHPTSGQIEVNGRVSALIELGSGFHPDLTGRENVYLNGTILGLSRKEIRRRFDEIVAFSEIERFMETPVKRYSSGMLVRLGFAVASCVQPDILLVDEVLAVGDASFSQKCLQRIRSLLNDGTSILFVSHNLYMAQAVCPSALYIERGQLKHQGPIADVIDRYEHDLHEERARNAEASHASPTVTTDVEITEVEVFDSQGHASNQFLSDQTATLRVSYDNHRASGAAHAVVHIIRTDGFVCSMMRTALDGEQLWLQPGSGSFSVVIDPLQLTGGTYFFDIQITNDTDSIILAKRASKWFYVSGLALSDTEDHGVFEPRRRWVVQPQLGDAVAAAVHDGFSRNGERV